MSLPTNFNQIQRIERVGNNATILLTSGKILNVTVADIEAWLSFSVPAPVAAPEPVAPAPAPKPAPVKKSPVKKAAPAKKAVKKVAAKKSVKKKTSKKKK